MHFVIEVIQLADSCVGRGLDGGTKVTPGFPFEPLVGVLFFEMKIRGDRYLENEYEFVDIFCLRSLGRYLKGTQVI